MAEMSDQRRRSNKFSGKEAPTIANFQRSHRLPEQLANIERFAPLYDLLDEEGRTFLFGEFSKNGQYLPSNDAGLVLKPDVSLHRGPHPAYTAAVEKQLEVMRLQLEAVHRAGGDIASAEAAIRRSLNELADVIAIASVGGALDPENVSLRLIYNNSDPNVTSLDPNWHSLTDAEKGLRLRNYNDMVVERMFSNGKLTDEGRILVDNIRSLTGGLVGELSSDQARLVHAARQFANESELGLRAEDIGKFIDDHAAELRAVAPELGEAIDDLGRFRRLATIAGRVAPGMLAKVNVATTAFDIADYAGTGLAYFNGDAVFRKPLDGDQQFEGGFGYLADTVLNPATQAPLDVIEVPKQFWNSDYEVSDWNPVQEFLRTNYLLPEGWTFQFNVVGPRRMEYWIVNPDQPGAQIHLFYRVAPGNGPANAVAPTSALFVDGRYAAYVDTASEHVRYFDDPTGEIGKALNAFLTSDSASERAELRQKILALGGEMIALPVQGGEEFSFSAFGDAKKIFEMRRKSEAASGDLSYGVSEGFHDLVNTDSQGFLVLVIGGATKVFHGVVHELRQVLAAAKDLAVSVGEGFSAGPASVFDNLRFPPGAILSYQDLGGILSAQLVQALPIDNPWARIGASSILSGVMTNLGQALDLAGASDVSLTDALSTAFEDLPTDIQMAGTGAISSYLTGELLANFGLEGDTLEAATALAGPTLGRIAFNLLQMRQGQAGVSWNSGLSQGFYATIAANYIGGKLADQIVEFESVYGQIGASIGSSVGSIVAVKLFGKALATMNPYAIAAAAIVVALSKLTGGFIGSLFGASKSYVTVSWDGSAGAFRIGDVRTVRGGSRDGAVAIGHAVADGLNQVVEMVGATVLAPEVRSHEFGMRNNDYVYWNAQPGSPYRSDSFDDVFALGVRNGLTSLIDHMAGGGVFSKRALAANLSLQTGEAFSLTGLTADLTVAADFATYLQNPEMVRDIIEADPQGAIAAGWTLTLARAMELGLHRRASTDWIGGWGVFLDEAPDERVDGAAWNAGSLDLRFDASGERMFTFLHSDGFIAGEVGDTVEAAAKDRWTGTSGADSIVINGATVGAVQGVTGEDGPLAGRTIDVAAVIDGGAGDDLIRGGDRGNDLLGGTGADTLVGGKLDDWLFGGAGNDRLFAGAVSSVDFAAGGGQGEAAAVAAAGGDGNYLDGGAGDDRLHGGAGSDWLAGGEGADRLVGGAGDDVLDGGAGDDQAAGAAGLLGGAGDDQYVFGFGYGSDIILDSAGATASDDSLSNRLALISAGLLERSWGGAVDQASGSVSGGEDSISFAAGVTMRNVVLRRSGTEAEPGADLIITLVAPTEAGVDVPTGDTLVVRNWFSADNRVEWLRFADGEALRLGDITSFVVGTDGPDVVLGTYGADFLYGGAGDDEMRGLAGDDFANGGAGNDFISGDGDQDWILGGSGDDRVFGGGGHDTLSGDAGHDRVSGGEGSDIIAGGLGDDELTGGAGDDIFRYALGDGADVLIDDLVDNWDLVYSGGQYVNGYVLQANGTVTKNGEVWFDGSRWLGGSFEWNDETRTLRRHRGAVDGVIVANNGVDTIEFAPGINLQDLQFQREGADLVVGVAGVNGAGVFAGLTDRIALKDWYTAGPAIERFAFAATGVHNLAAMQLGAGSDTADVLTGSTGADWITGNAGDDRIDAGAGADILSGGAGDDRLDGGQGDDVLYGGADNDTLEGGAGRDFLFGGAGEDLVSFAGSAQGVRAYLDASHARFATGDAAGDRYAEVEGVEGSAFDDRLGGGGVDDILRGGAGNDSLSGGAGDDLYAFGKGEGGDVIREGRLAIREVVDANGALLSGYQATWTYLGHGPAGVGTWHRYRLEITDRTTGDVVYRSRDNIDFLYAQTQPATPAAAAWPFANGQWRDGLGRTGNNQQIAGEVITAGEAGEDTIRFDRGIGLSDLGFSRSGDDLVIAVSGGGVITVAGHYLADRGVEFIEFADGLVIDLAQLAPGRLAGGVGDDVLTGSGAADILTGGDGADALSGGAGNDQLAGGAGDDILEGGAGADILDGGGHAGVGDVIRYVGSGAAVAIDLATASASGGDAQGDVIVVTGGVSTIEHVVGSDGYGDVLLGDGRANRLAGLGGDDRLEGRVGDDRLEGGDGDDILLGGEGDDVLSGGDGVDQLEGGAGADVLAGGRGADTLSGGLGADILAGDDGDDTLQGGADADSLAGGAGNDELRGDTGDDVLSGDAGDDALSGGDGNDILSGGAGADLLQGGAGLDTYQFGRNTGVDRIIDGDGPSEILFEDAGSRDLWLTRSGDDLLVSVIGGDAVVRFENYYAADADRSATVHTSDGVLHVDAADALVSAMTTASATPPTGMPKTILDMLGSYWHPTGRPAPRVADARVTTAEDTAVSGVVGAVDHDGNIVSYALARGPSAGVVQLDASGNWTYTPRANLHGDDYFIVSVTDADGQTAQKRIDVSIASVADAPSDIRAIAPLTVAEGAADGSVVGHLAHTDGDGAADIGVFSLVDDAGGRFAITPYGQLVVANGAALDHETAAFHNIRVRVTDASGLYSEKTIVVPVADVNERPSNPVVLQAYAGQVNEGEGGGVDIAQFASSDPDGGSPAFVLLDNPLGVFEMAGDVLRLKAGAALDFEALRDAGYAIGDEDGDGVADARLVVSLAATDGALSSQAITVSVAVEDVNEAPSTPTFTPLIGQIAERDRPQAGAVLPAVLLGTLSATDPDTAGTDFANLVYTIVDDRFEVVNGNQLRLRAGAVLDFEAGRYVTVSVRAVDRGGEGLSSTATVTLEVGDRDDYLYGTEAGELLVGQAGRDVIAGYGGNDVLTGGAGADDLDGGDGDDEMSGDAGDDRLWGGLGADFLVGGDGQDHLWGGVGDDHLSGGEGGDALDGGSGDDRLEGGAGDDALQGGSGADVLLGQAGADTLTGASGDDILDGGAGADALNGGDGYDTASYASAGAGVIADLVAGGTGGEAAGDTYVSIERLVGSAFNDRLRGSAADDVLEGGAGADILYGGDGNDHLIGGDGNDQLFAEAGGDILDGGRGNDLLVGGLGSDTYLIDVDSGADVIREFDPSGADIDVVGYRDIDRARLWFERNGDDLVVSVIGSTASTRIEDWYLATSAADRSNYKIDFFLAGQHFTRTIDAEGLVGLMAGYTRPASMAAYDALHADLAFQNQWANFWDSDGAPVIAPVATQTLQEDGSLSVQIVITDDITPVTGMTVSAQAVKATDFSIVDNALISAPVVGTPDAAGRRTLTFTAKPNASGSVGVKILAVDPGGLVTERVFIVNIAPVADAPVITQARALATTLDTGPLGLDIQAALVDKDGSETLGIRISNVPAGLALNKGTDLGGGVWALTPAQLSGLALTGPAGWATDLTGAAALKISVTATETATRQSATTERTLAFAVNARPTDIAAGGALTVRESISGNPVATGTVVGSFTRVDADNDAATFSLLDNAGGRFSITTTGVLKVANGALLDREAAASHTIRIRVTDSGGLTRDETFTVAVVNVNETPTTPGAAQAIVQSAENAAVSGKVVATLSATDPDGTSPSFVLSANPSGLFVISGAELRFATGATLDFEALKAAGHTLVDTDGDGRQEVELAVRVRSSDGALSSGDRTVNVRVEDVNEAPTDIAADRTLTIAENSANGALVATFTSTDPDAGDTRTFALVDNAGGRFALTAAGRLTVANGALLNREAATSHAIKVRVTDAGGLTREETLTVAVSNVNEAPTKPTLTQPSIKAENSALAGTTLATLAATDPDGTTPTYQIVNDPLGWLALSGASLKFKTGLAFNFETLATTSGVTLTDADNDGLKEATYTATVRSTDGSLSSAAQAVTIRIEDVNEAFTLGGLSTKSLAESAPGAGQTLVGAITVSDPDTQAVNRNHVFSLSGADASAFSINSQGQVYLQAGLNYEAKTQYSFTVNVRDRGGSGFSSSRQVTVNVADVNEAPTISLSNYRYLYGIDPEGDAIRWEVVSATKTIEQITRDAFGGEDEWTSTLAASTTGMLSGNKIIVVGAREQWTSGDQGGYDYETHLRTTTYDLKVRGVDEHGVASGTMNVHIGVASQYNLPIVLDLDGDGFDWIDLEAGITFDHDADGVADPTGWLGADDAFLVLDRNGNGLIDDGSEISFSGDMPHGLSDLEGLRAYDTSGNGIFDAADAEYASFRLWRDVNQDGVSQAGELFSLHEVGVAAINLTLTLADSPPDGMSNALHGTTSYLRDDGTAGLVGDAMLVYQTQTITYSMEPPPASPGDADGGALPGMLPPVVLDLGGDGLDLVSLAQSAVRFDADGDGVLERTGWVAASDGLLALDRNGDGRIGEGAEISFVSDLPGARTDLEGLTAFDSNGDGFLDAGDARFADFRVWRDLDQDGVSQDSELWSLADAGVAGINLGRRAAEAEGPVGDNRIVGTSEFIRVDGSVSVVGDVMLAYTDTQPEPVFQGEETGRHLARTRAPWMEDTADMPVLRPDRGWPRSDFQEPLVSTGQFGEAVRIEIMDDAGTADTGTADTGTAGTGTADVDGIDRRADRPRSAVQRMREAMQAGFGADRHADVEPLAIDRFRPFVTVDIADVARARNPRPVTPELNAPAPSAPDEDGSLPAPVRASALDSGLGLSAKLRLQMVGAMAGFGAEPFMQGLAPRSGNDRHAAPLLTSLPDARI